MGKWEEWGKVGESGGKWGKVGGNRGKWGKDVGQMGERENAEIGENLESQPVGTQPLCGSQTSFSGM